jgi:ribosomal protein L32
MSIRMRHTSGHTGNRRSHHALKDIRLGHRVDEATGMYRGKQIFTPKVKTEHGKKTKGPDTEPAAKHSHEHAREEHLNAEIKSSKGILGKISAATRPKARSGFGGGV